MTKTTLPRTTDDRRQPGRLARGQLCQQQQQQRLRQPVSGSRLPHQGTRLSDALFYIILSNYAGWWVELWRPPNCLRYAFTARPVQGLLFPSVSLSPDDISCPLTSVLFFSSFRFFVLTKQQTIAHRGCVVGAGQGYGAYFFCKVTVVEETAVVGGVAGKRERSWCPFGDHIMVTTAYGRTQQRLRRHVHTCRHLIGYGTIRHRNSLVEIKTTAEGAVTARLNSSKFEWSVVSLQDHAAMLLLYDTWRSLTSSRLFVGKINGDLYGWHNRIRIAAADMWCYWPKPNNQIWWQGRDG